MVPADASLDALDVIIETAMGWTFSHLHGFTTDEALEELLMDFEDDESAQWLYTWALTLFRRGGPCDAANDVLDDDLDANQEIAALLLNLKKLPPGVPSRVPREDVVEAPAYVTEHLDLWRGSQGALRWLRRQLTDWGRRLSAGF